MNVKQAIEQRRSLRSYEKTDISPETLDELARSASLAPSCYNNQPWRFVFAHGPDDLERLQGALAKGNSWALNASALLAVYADPDDDCTVQGRQYHLFDTGMAVGFMQLRAVELGLEMHGMAGFDGDKAKEVLGIPDSSELIAIFAIGRKAPEISSELNDSQRAQETERPPRKELGDFAFFGRHGSR